MHRGNLLHCSPATRLSIFMPRSPMLGDIVFYNSLSSYIREMLPVGQNLTQIYWSLWSLSSSDAQLNSAGNFGKGCSGIECMASATSVPLPRPSIGVRGSFSVGRSSPKVCSQPSPGSRATAFKPVTDISTVSSVEILLSVSKLQSGTENKTQTNLHHLFWNANTFLE